MALPAMPLPLVAAEPPGHQHRRYLTEEGTRGGAGRSWREECGSRRGDPEGAATAGSGERRGQTVAMEASPGGGGRGPRALRSGPSLHPGSQAATTAPGTSTSTPTKEHVCHAVSPAQPAAPSPLLPSLHPWGVQTPRHKGTARPSPPGPPHTPTSTSSHRADLGPAGLPGGWGQPFRNRRPGGCRTAPAATLAWTLGRRKGRGGGAGLQALPASPSPPASGLGSRLEAPRARQVGPRQAPDQLSSAAPPPTTPQPTTGECTHAGCRGKAGSTAGPPLA